MSRTTTRATQTPPADEEHHQKGATTITERCQTDEPTQKNHQQPNITMNTKRPEQPLETFYANNNHANRIPETSNNQTYNMPLPRRGTECGDTEEETTNIPDTSVDPATPRTSSQRQQANRH